MDGRDIGTVVLPNATVKIFLTATPEARAERRYKELLMKGEKHDYQNVLADVRARDYQDTHRAAAPLRQAEDAVLVCPTEKKQVHFVLKKAEQQVGRSRSPTPIQHEPEVFPLPPSKSY